MFRFAAVWARGTRKREAQGVRWAGGLCYVWVLCILCFIEQSTLLLFNPRHHVDQLRRTPLCGQPVTDVKQCFSWCIWVPTNNGRHLETLGLGRKPGCC